MCVVSSEISTAHQSLRATLNLIRTQARLCPLTIACHVSLPSVCAYAIQRPTPPQNNHRAACLFGAITIINELITGLHTFQIFFLFFFKSATQDAGAADQYWHAEVMMGLTHPARMMGKLLRVEGRRSGAGK